MSSGGSDASACAFMELTRAGSAGECYGVGIDANIVTASIRALVNGVNRLTASAGVGCKTRAA
jgi:2-isopropylmalate synthase